MKYRVELDPLAEQDLHEAYLYVARNASATAVRWLERFEATLKSLDRNPERCGFALECKRLKVDLRQILFGRRNVKYRAVFLIDDKVVRILRIRRATMRSLKRKDLGGNS